MSAPKQFATFFLDGHYFAVEVLKVQEILRCQQLTTVPLAPMEVRGLMNLRGQIVTGIDLRRRLGMADGEESPAHMTVVVRTEEDVIAFLVDDVGDVVEVSDAEFEPVPDTLRGLPREFIRGVYKMDGRLLLVLDAERAMQVCPDQVGAAAA